VWIETACRSWLSSNNFGVGDVWEDRDNDGETKNNFTLKTTGLNTQTFDFVHYDDDRPIVPFFHRY
jgi:hypothetical protein